MKNQGLDYDAYKQITKQCIICGFDKIVGLYHLDGDRKNNSKDNLIGLCPNHHKMIHNSQFRVEIRKALQEKGLQLPEDKKLDFKLS